VTPGSIEQVWATSGFEAKTSPTFIGGTAVLYGAVGDALYLIGLDPANGAERWRRPASAAAFPPSTEVKVVRVGDFVAYLRPVEDDRLSQIVLIDPVSGVDQVASEPMEWSSLPEVCDDDDSYVCGSAYDRSSGDETIPSRHFRMDRASGATTLVPEKTEDASRYTRLYNDFVQVNGAPVETVGIVKDGTLVWSRPLADIAGAGATLDHGWYANDEHGDIPISYLSVTVGWAEADGKFPPLDLATNLVTVGVNSTDGSVVWSQPGTWIGCRDGLPARSEMSTPGSWSPALWCRYTGRLDSTPTGHDYRLTTPSDLTVSLERVNVQTGQPVWSVPLGAEPSVAVDSNGVRVGLLDDHRLLIGGQVLDVVDGSTRPPADGETFWCPRSQSFTQARAWNGVDGSVRYDRRIEGEFFLCGGASNAISGIPTAIPRAASSGTDDGLWFVSTPDGVVAYRVPQ
jgi:hypothetical protein